MPTFVDYAGMNTLVSSSIEGNTISSGRNTEIATIPVEEELVGINLHRNGPYGYSSWKQLRVSENPVTRNHVANSTMTFVTEPGPIMNLGQNGELRVRSRYSALYNYTEPAIAQKAFPLVWNVGRHFKDEDGQLAPEPQKFSIVSSYGNQQIGFANEKVDKLLKFDPDEEQTEYVAIADMYLENGLNKQDSPLTYWEFLQYRETVYPHMKNQFQNENLERPTFESFFRHLRPNRTKLFATSSLGYHPYWTNTGETFLLSQSTWPLDASQNFLTRTWVNDQELVGKDPAGSYTLPSWLERAGEGKLQNRFTQYAYDMVDFNTAPVSLSASNSISGLIGVGPLYFNRTISTNSRQQRNPSGMSLDYIPRDNTALELNFATEALWEAGPKRFIKDPSGIYISAPKLPFYDTYEAYIEEARRKHKNFSVVPEFRMSTQVEDYRRTNNAIELDMFDVTGGVSGTTNSSTDNFYEIYSNSDFMRNFEVIDDDHKDFTNGKVLSLRCKAVKKFLPYEGFYPAQRTVTLAEQLVQSIGKGITLWTSVTSSISSSAYEHVKQYVVAPLYAPGIMFNTIKSGISVDYPIVTGAADNSPEIRDANFDARIPFEALLDPKNYLQDLKLFSNNFVSTDYTNQAARWDGQSDGLYEMMVNNFLAESISFFLPDGNLTTLLSKKQRDIPEFKKGQVYGMRIKMYRSMSGSNNTVYHAGKSEKPYSPPQDLIVTGNFPQETFTMYSKPTAFGPISRGLSSFDNSGGNVFAFENGPYSNHGVNSYEKGFNYGYNFPFTPPYYHGEAWCDMWLTGSSELDTIEKIQNAITSSFTRFDGSYLESDGAVAEESTVGGPQVVFENRINNNAVQLSSSLNIFGISRVKQDINKSSNIVDTAVNESNRWTIQTKFETPMLNFNHVSGSDHISYPAQGKEATPIGMWHQHGRIPEAQDGVFLSVNAIPQNYSDVVMNNPSMADLSDILGFSGTPTKVGRIASSKKISECVVAVPFIEKEGGKKFFRLALSDDQLEQYKSGDKQPLITGPAQSQIGRSVLLQLDKMEKFVFPPSFDFLRFPDVEPVAMYAFEFSHTLSQQDLSDIWQNLPPDIGTTMEVSELAITHPLLQKELLGQGGEEGNQTIDMPERLKWMVFKVKQRASTNYFKKTVLRNPEVNTDVNNSNVTKDEFGDTSPIQYNWPYDFFSLVELVKIDAEVEMGNIDFSDYTDNMPAWDGVSADRDKIEQIVGGLEDDPIPEVQIPELMGQELAVSTQVFAGTDIEGRRKALGNNVVTGTTMAAGVQFGSQLEEEGTGPSYEEQVSSLKFEARAVWMDQFVESDGFFTSKKVAAEEADGVMDYEFRANPFYKANAAEWKKEFRAEKGIS